MTALEQYLAAGREAGCPQAQMANFAGLASCSSRANSRRARRRDCATRLTGRRRSVTAGRVVAASRIGCSRRWVLTTASAFLG